MDRLIAKQTTQLLAARDRRHAALARVLQAGAPATLQLSLNLPGPDKMPAGARPLFAWALREAMLNIPGLRLQLNDHDVLGPYAIATLPGEPLGAKRCCLRIEDSRPVARLLDLDIYTAAGRQIGRSSLGQAARPCLLCPQPAVDCMRSRRHPYPDLIARAHELLAAFAT